MPGHPDLAEDRDIPWEDDGPAPPGAAAEPAGAVYYRLPDTPEGLHIKEYANGTRQLVRFVGLEEQVVKTTLM
ncbi:hypothetical protein L602_005500000060 [Cupriavidus gilardii J11]|uniref:Uncharacterized protein n=1 Tax=Cupriavidus gilardii J11 TaxID=936133 RepID=A0A562B4Q5_9BURK|nr:hypothetical protein [Cupriavidus gilardii]TWG79969.1 hypothetical protein L602_005500000060 [Cupriavidus gilardii J11]